MPNAAYAGGDCPNADIRLLILARDADCWLLSTTVNSELLCRREQGLLQRASRQSAI